jgi:putative tryptophan/tyrosine transport system substrate-binding protein
MTFSPELSGKRLELLKEAFPNVSRVAVLTNPANPEQEARVKETKVAAQGLRVRLQILEVREPSASKWRSDGLYVLGTGTLMAPARRGSG